jgi:1-acyl-sn-glycerol-3-phosphate acyltransferase
MRRALDALAVAACTTDVPLALFPEGTRTRDGTIGRFKRGGLTRILAARAWTVYVFVADGFWKAARLQGFARGLPDIDGKIEHVATLEWTDSAADPNPFLDHVRDLMVKKLDEMRGGARVA